MNKNAIEYCLSITPYLESFCAPLKEYFGIQQFHYAKIYKNGKYIIVSNDIVFNQSWINNVKDANIFFRDYLKSNIRYDCILWPYYPQNPSMELYFKHGYWHGLTLVLDKSDEFVELVCFLANKDHHTITEFYCRHTSVLERFANQFKKLFSEKINLTPQDDRMAIFTQGVDIFIPDKNLLRDNENINSFYKAIGMVDNHLQPKNLKTFTPTELKILKLSSMGYTAKDIANEYRNSPKTIEKHIQNIKQKTMLHYKSDLIKNYKDFL